MQNFTIKNMENNALFKRKYILGSASPRRKELLKGLDIDFIVDTNNNFIEEYPNNIELESIPEYLACGKSKGFHRDLKDNETLITADTMVLCKGEIMGKPKNYSDAKRMLEKLSDSTHSVITGVCIRDINLCKSFSVTTEVTFNNLSSNEIDYYISNYNPMDKAGAYAVQEWIGHIGISKINGSYFNVVGLPVQKLYSELKNIYK